MGILGEDFFVKNYDTFNGANMEDPSSFMNMMILTIFLHIDSTTQTSCMQGDESPGSDSDVFSISSRRTLQKTTTAVVSFLKKLPCHQNQLTFSPRKINIESNLNNDGNFGRLIFRTSRGPIIILRFQPLIFRGVCQKIPLASLSGRHFT